jgi:3-hydroxymyristoyl/3-hydroxydecanoyl-(acyl carrier protein) dehydratase
MATSGGLARVRPVCRTVFSSGGPLEADTARRVAALLGEAPIEILGSTETGGVAQRQRAASERPWTPLPGVRVERAKDGRLRVTSPFVSAGEVATAGQRRFTMGDRAELAPDGTFALLGRADRTVKIGERRLALPEMERDLAAHPAVAEAALFVRPHASEPRVHAAVVLGEAGWQTLRRDGRRELGRALAGHLAARWDPVLLPRLWRYVDELPRNAQGKLPLASLEALFDSRGGAPFDPRGGAPVDPRDRDPILQGEARGADWLERRLEVPDDLVYLEGHFDGQPIVAGVVQLRWVMDAARELLGGAPRVRSFEALKFPELLRPGQHFALRVEHRDRLRFRLYAGDRVFATGRALLAGPEGERP